MLTRAVFHRGYVLVSSLYFVITAHLSASQLVFLAAVMATAYVVSDIPLGIWADAFSRKWTLVIGHLFLAAGMVTTGLVTTMPLLVLSQVLWAVGWAFSSGADVAWLSDELNQPDQIDRVLVARSRMDLVGSAMGMVLFGVVGWALGLPTAIVVSGVAMAVVGAFVAYRFTETNFSRARGLLWHTSLSIFRRSLRLAWQDQELLVVFAATLIINGAGQVAWLFPRRLIDIGLPSPVLWYTALGVAAYVVGAVALRVVGRRIHEVGAARKTYTLACCIGGLGLLVVALTSTVAIAAAGVLVFSGIADNVARAVSVVWVNRRTPSEVRATVHSFLSQAEHIGEICFGYGLAFVAQRSGTSTTLATSAALLAVAGVIVAASRADRGGHARHER